MLWSCDTVGGNPAVPTSFHHAFGNLVKHYSRSEKIQDDLALSGKTSLQTSLANLLFKNFIRIILFHFYVTSH